MRKRKTPETTVKPAPRHIWWAAPFALFLIVRLFSGDPYYLLGGDQVTFLELGRTFPRHHLFGHQLYLLHPPLFGYSIGLLHIVLPLLAAGLLATLLFACANFFVVAKLGEIEGMPRAAIFVGLTYIALNRPAAAYDYHVARVSILVFTTALALLSFVHLLREPSRKAVAWATAANAICLLVSDQALLLLPCEAVLLWARGPVGEWKRWAVVAAGSAVAALFWPLVRFYEFSTHTDLAAGIDGTIEITRNFPWMAAIQPNFLPFTNMHRSLFTQTSLSLFNLNPLLLWKLPIDLLVLPQALSTLVVLVLAVAPFVPQESRKRAAQWLVLSVLMLLPVGLGMNEWYGMGFIVPFALLLMEGAAVCIARARASERAVTVALSAACAMAAGLWLSAAPPEPHDFLSPRGGIDFLFSRPSVTRGAAISHFFDKMPGETGIMAPQGLSPEIAYLTGKRVVALPFDPALLERFINEYRISYLVASSEHLPQFQSPVVDEYTGHLVTRYLFEHPERFHMVQRVREDYPAFYPPTEYYVFEVRSAASNPC